VNIKAITNSIKLENENLTKKDVVSICGGTRDVAKNEAKDGLQTLSEFAKLTSNTNVILTCVPNRFDLQPSSCVNKEVESFNRKLQKTLKTYSHVHVCSMNNNREYFTSHGLHLNSQGKKWIINKWKSIITPMISKSTAISVTPLPWTEQSDKNHDEQEHRKELGTTEGKNMTEEKHSLSKEEIFYSAPELEVGRGFSNEEGVSKETPGSPISKMSNQCKRSDDEDAKYIVSKMDLTYNLRDEKDKEEGTIVIPSTGKIRKSNRIKNPQSDKLSDFFYGQFKSE
jgi:hypothetical protein